MGGRLVSKGREARGPSFLTRRWAAVAATMSLVVTSPVSQIRKSIVSGLRAWCSSRVLVTASSVRAHARKSRRFWLVAGGVAGCCARGGGGGGCDSGAMAAGSCINCAEMA